jgi:YidC/Oxa1 family membrane protein insertase
MFTTLIVQPIFNLLVLIYALLPGHNFGVAIIVFTIVIRLLMWPLVKKQLHHTKAMRALQPEIKRIKKDAKGDRQKESAMTMELYKERGINPFATLGLTLVQFPILIGLYVGLNKVIHHPEQIVDFAYPFLRNLGWLKHVTTDISQFHISFFGINLTRAALGPGGVWYIPGLILVAGSAITQYLQSKQLLPTSKDSKSLRQILKDASSGSKADSSEMQAATGRFTSLMIPFLIFFVTLRIASALSLYWFTSGLVAYLQQARVLNQDEEEMEEIADKGDKAILEGEIIEKKSPKKTKAKKARTSAKSKKRRK